MEVERGRIDTVGTRQELARELTYLRIRAGLSVRDIAGRLDMPTATVGDYFSGRHLPGPARVGSFRRLLAECGVADDEVAHQWLRAVARVKAATDRRVSREPAPARSSPAPTPAPAPAPSGGPAATAAFTRNAPGTVWARGASATGQAVASPVSSGAVNPMS